MAETANDGDNQDKKKKQANAALLKTVRESRVFSSELHGKLLKTTVTTAEEFGERDHSESDIELPHEIDKEINELSDQRFEIKQTLGKGGGGTVYEVVDNHLRRSAALKVKHQYKGNSPKHKAHFINEACITSSLEHPNILPVYDLARTSDGQLYYTMRKAEGVSLDTLIEAYREGSIHELVSDLQDRVQIIIHVCDAIAYAHSKGVIHQDIKPENIMLGEFGEVTVVDWGTAFLKDDFKKGRMAGTPVYMSPEQARREVVDERSDIYCIGTTMYHLFSGMFPVSADSEENFMKHKREGIIDPFPAEVSSYVPEFLQNIIMQALAKDPQDRYQRVIDLQQDLRGWLRNRESLAISNRADELLDVAKNNGNHERFSHILSSYQQALELWPENEMAQEGLHQAHVVYAEFAIQSDEFDLAERLLRDHPDEHPELQEQISKGKQRILRQKKRAKMAIAALALLVLLGIVFISYVIKENELQQNTWFQVAQWDQSQPMQREDIENAYLNESATGSNLNDNFRDGLIHFAPTEFIKLKDIKERGNVKIDIDMQWLTRIDGFEVLLRAKDERLAQFWHVPTSYVAQFAGWGGEKTFVDIIRNSGGPNARQFATPQFEIDTWYKLSFEVDGDWLRLFVDGELIFERQNLLEIGGPECSTICIRSWGPTVVRNVTVWSQRPAEKSSPIIAGDSLAAAHHYHDAYLIYQELAKEFAGTAIAERALAKAFIMANKIDSVSSEDAELLLSTLNKEFPNSQYKQLCQEIHAEELWGKQQNDAALSLLERIIKKYPSSNVINSFLDRGNQSLSSKQEQRFLQAIAQDQRITHLSFRGFSLKNIDALRGMNLKSLELVNSQIKNINALTGMPLERLNLRNTQVSDLSPLNTCSTLKHLDLAVTPVSDLGPIKSSVLETIDIRGTRINTLDGLAHLPLKRLGFRRCNIDSIEPLRNHKQLAFLDFDGELIKDYSPLKGLKLERLEIHRAHHADDRIWDFIADMPLRFLAIDHGKITYIGKLSPDIQSLQLAHNPIKDARGLGRLGQLRLLHLGHTQIDNIQFINGKHLDTLLLNGCKNINPQSLTVLSALPSLKKLSMSECNFSSLPTLTLPVLEQFYANKNNLKHIPSFIAPELSLLSINNNAISEINIESLPSLETLHINNNQIRRLDALRKRGIQLIAFINPLRAGEFNKLMAAWSHQQVHRKYINQLQLQRLLFTKNVEGLKRKGTLINGKTYLNTQIQLPYAEAQAFINSYQAQLPELYQRQDIPAFSKLVNLREYTWINLQQDFTWPGEQPTPFIRSHHIPDKAPTHQRFVYYRWNRLVPFLFDQSGDACVILMWN